jgi:hypothetical protein
MKKPLFSERTSWDLSENDLTRDLGAARGEARALVDLTESNPTRAGLADTEGLVALLGHPRGAAYAPLALGHPTARAAVAAYYADRGLDLPIDRIVLSASTSEAYGWLFKLLTERGDKVLVPAPSYPLFAFLAALEDVELVPYPLMREEGFRIDLHALEAAIDEDTKAILLVHPNNPTGSFVRRDEADALEAIALRHGLAIIADEVFGDYAFAGLPADRLPSFVGPRRALTFVLSGLSKVVALPQLKLGWIGVLGPDDVAHEARNRLEVIADTYLSVGTPVQLALPEILAARGPIQAAIRARTAKNLLALDAALAALGAEASVRRLPVEGGWYAILEVPRTRDEDAWVQLFVREEGIILHPGYFFDLPDEGFLVVSLLPDEAVFARAIATVLRRLVEA